MRTYSRLLIALLLLAGVLVAIPAQAAPLACGDTITTDTTLTADLLACPGDGLIIGADNITLDCDGHKVTGTASGVVGIEVNFRSGVT